MPNTVEPSQATQPGRRATSHSAAEFDGNRGHLALPRPGKHSRQSACEQASRLPFKPPAGTLDATTSCASHIERISVFNQLELILRVEQPGA